jgi:demethoxyubiquinone hydroxylase (CLK1/Coq7/Cat5 family)
MNKEVYALKFMYNMERFATQIYLTQRRAFAGSEIKDKLEKASTNERQHVEYLQKRVIELNEVPSRFGFLFQLVGILMGLITMCLGRLFILKADTWVEKRAIKDYGSFIKKLNFDRETESLLKKIIKDEEKHVETWQNSVKVLRGKTRRES